MGLICKSAFTECTGKSVEVLQTLENNGRVLGSFSAFLNRQDELRHAYKKFRFTGNADKPLFDDVYGTVKLYIMEVLSEKE